MAAIVFLVLLAVLIGSVLIRDRHSEAALPPAAKVRVELEDGNLVLKRSTDDTLALERRDEYVLRGPRLDHRIDGDVLVIEIECPRFNVGRCTSDVEISVPGLTDVVANVGDGNVSTLQLQGPGQLRTGNGKIRAEGTFGPIDMDVGNGTISGKDLSSTEVRARAGNGAVDLEFSTSPKSIDAETGNGNVDVRLPEESGPFAVDASTGNGKTTIDVRDDDRSPNKVRARTGNGDISIERR